VAPHGRRRDEEPVGRPAGGESLAQTIEHLPFAPGQIVLSPPHEGGLPAHTCPELANQTRGELTRKRRLAAEDAPVMASISRASTRRSSPSSTGTYPAGVR